MVTGCEPEGAVALTTKLPVMVVGLTTFRLLTFTPLPPTVIVVAEVKLVFVPVIVNGTVESAAPVTGAAEKAGLIKAFGVTPAAVTLM